jgi:ubiquinone/menaquinone biosynthesis C-methylase UbiE
LVFHHLTRENKLRTPAEVFRILRPGGELHIADYGKPQNRLMRGAFKLVEKFDGRETPAENVKGLLPELLQQAGFEDVKRTAQFMTITSTLALYRGRKPTG